MSKQSQSLPGLLHSKHFEHLSPTKQHTHSLKMSRLEDKAYFFQGQLNPLHTENIQLKEELIYARRIVAEKTVLLKSLLSRTDRNGKSRDLYLETASLEEICTLIEEDWKHLRLTNQQLEDQLNNAHAELKCQLMKMETISKQHQSQLDRLTLHIKELVERNAQTLKAHVESVQCLQRQFDENLESKNKELEARSKQNESLRQSVTMLQEEMARRMDENRLRMKMLQNDYDTLDSKCEESKRLMATLFDHQLKDKVDELNRAFESVLSAREEQHQGELAALKTQEEQLRQHLREREEEIQKGALQRREKEQEIMVLLEKKKELEKAYEKMQFEKVRGMNQIDKLKVERAGLTETLRQREKDLTQASERHESAKQQFLKERTKLKQQLMVTENDLMETKKLNFLQKTDFESLIASLKVELTEQESILKGKIKTVQEEWNQKYKRVVIVNIELDTMIKNEKRKSEQLIVESQKMRTEYEVKLKEEKDKGVQRIEAAKMEEMQKRKAMEEQFCLQKLGLERAAQNRVKQVRATLKEEIKQLNQEIKRMKEEQAMAEKMHHEQIKEIKESQRQMIEGLQESLSKHDEMMKEEIKRREEQHLRHIHTMEVQIQEKAQELLRQQEENKATLEAERHKHQGQISALKDSFQSEKVALKQSFQLQKVALRQCFQLQKSALSKAFEQRLVQITQSFEEKMEEIRSLNKTDKIQHYYQEQMEKLTEKFAAERRRIEEAFEQQIQEIITQHNRKCEQLLQDFEARLRLADSDQASRINQILKQLERVKVQHEGELVELSRKFEDDIGQLNTLLLDEKEEHHMTRMTKQEKIEYLSGKISELMSNFRALQEEKSNLEGDLIRKNKEIRDFEERLEVLIQERLREIEEEKEKSKQIFDKKLLEKDKQCATKVKECKEEQLRFSSSIHTEFQNIKRIHCSQIDELAKRYHELEQLFMERPSRPEDLSFIKELQEQREGMNKMVEAAEMKVKRANDIVRYLQLELENYKETFDIFGPNCLEIEEDDRRRRLSTQVPEDMIAMKRHRDFNNDSPFSNHKTHSETKKNSSLTPNQLPPLSIEHKSFEVVEGAQRFMEIIKESSKHESINGRKKITSSRKRQISYINQESSPIDNPSEFHLRPRRVSRKVNNLL